MPNATVPAAAAGLPGETAVLAETDHGLAIIRPKALKALRPTFLSAEETDKLLGLLDQLVNATQLRSHVFETQEGAGNNPNYKSADADAQKLRRMMISPLKKIRNAKSKTLDDILFKALIVEGVDHYDCRASATLGHSIVNDLLSADCLWRAA